MHHNAFWSGSELHLEQNIQSFALHLIMVSRHFNPPSENWEMVLQRPCAFTFKQTLLGTLWCIANGLRGRTNCRYFVVCFVQFYS